MGEGLRARLLGFHDRQESLDLLSAHADDNLVLIDLVERLGSVPPGGDLVPQIQGVFDRHRLVGVAALRPSIVLSKGMSDDVLEALMPFVRRVPSGLIKCERSGVDRVWRTLRTLGREALIDRVEIAYRLSPDRIVAVAPTLPGFARPARLEDLDDLVYAARASLWEEDRPDPADGDPVGFRRWVQGRVGRARLVSDRGRTVFVAYADVRRPQGWLVQGVYTWPEARRRGFARRGMDSVIREAFAMGATHVQLAVIEGNDPASALYRNLGFEPFAELRTILFR
jgi:predicted GNAT family acetyltransferase